MTELIWDGKYDKDGKKVAPLRVSLPFQTVETINESAQERQKAFDLFSTGRDSEWRNRLIWGDKKYVLPSLLDEFAGKVNLIYIDPPFNVGADFSFQVQVGDEDDENESFTKEPSIIEQKAYRDTWGRGLDSYLQWFYETTALLYDLLSEDGSIYVHLDYHVSHYAKVILDDAFGADSFQNEIIWKRQTAHSDAQRYNPIHDTIFYFVKSPSAPFNHIHTAYDEGYTKSHYPYTDERGRRYGLWDMSSPHPRPNMMYEWKGYPAPPNGWRYEKKTMEKLEAEGRIHYPERGGKPRLKRFLEEMPGIPLQDMWADLNAINSQAKEATGYSTQKPETLLERIINASSNENDLVLDCFCGSGTTAAVAEKLNRRWITCDLGRFAIHTARKRLLSIPQVKPFVVQNLGKYERQVWQAAEFEGEGGKGKKQEAARQKAYTDFILKLYGARPIEGYTWLHGLKAGRMVHVGAVDAPITVGDVTHILSEFKKSIGTGKDAPSRNGADVLGWDFAFEINEVAKQQAAQANLNVRFWRIPREVLDKQAIAQGDIHFFELAALAVDVKQKKRDVTLTLTDFVIPPDDVPEDVQRAVKHWAQWIDYWAVDWNSKGDTFHNEWQAYRTRQERDLVKSTTHTYEEPGKYTIVIKVIDILGNDTTKTVSVEVK